MNQSKQAATQHMPTYRVTPFSENPGYTVLECVNGKGTPVAHFLKAEDAFKAALKLAKGE